MHPQTVHNLNRAQKVILGRIFNSNINRICELLFIASIEVQKKEWLHMPLREDSLSSGSETDR